MFVWKNENKRKRSRDWPFLKKNFIELDIFANASHALCWKYISYTYLITGRKM